VVVLGDFQWTLDIVTSLVDDGYNSGINFDFGLTVARRNRFSEDLDPLQLVAGTGFLVKIIPTA